MKRRGSLGLELIGLTVSIGLVLTFAAAFRIARVTGRSMEPTMKDGSYVLALRSPALMGQIERGDIVLVRLADSSGEAMIKRVAGVVGDSISAFEEAPNARSLMTMNVLQKDEYYLLGDNLENSVDSRVLGRVRGSEIIGKVMRLDSTLSVFPFALPMAGLGVVAFHLWLVGRAGLKGHLPFWT